VNNKRDKKERVLKMSVNLETRIIGKCQANSYVLKVADFESGQADRCFEE
jgi:hypothetical protein